MAEISEGTLEAILVQEIANSQAYDSAELAKRRKAAVEYVNGEIENFPAEEGRSSVTDMTVGETLSWMLPQIIRIHTASDDWAIAEPVEEGDEQWSHQATIGLNYTFKKQNPGYAIMHDATYDALLHGNGVVKHWWDTTPEEKISFHTGLGDLELQQLLEPEDNAVDENGEPCETIEVLDHKMQTYVLQPGDEGYYGYGDPDLDGGMDGGAPEGQQPPSPPQQPGAEAGPPSSGMPQAGPGAMTGDATGQPGQETAPLTGTAPTVVPGPRMGRLHDVKISRRSTYGKLRVKQIAPEDFIISSEALTIRGARMHGDKSQKTRSDLIEEGFDRMKVMGLTETQEDDQTTTARNDNTVGPFDRQPIDNKAMEQITHFELYLRIDIDGDDIAELVQCHLMGAPDGTGTLLEWSIWEDEPVYSDIPTYRIPHRWNADGLYWKTRDIAEVKTVLIRQALDNMYGTTDPQRAIVGRVLNPEVLNSPGFGTNILLDEGGSVTWSNMPFFADKAMEGVAFFDERNERRTGVSKTTMALDPEALQNTTATAAQLGHDANYVMVEYVARNHAELGWKEVFKTILKLMVRHQTKSCTVRLQNKQWVTFDPKHWNADMDITINTGLGTGSRDRDAAALTGLQADQVALAQIFREAQMPHLALKMVPLIVNSLKKKAEAIGIRSTDDFYPEVTQQDLMMGWQAIQAANKQPPIEIQLAQMQAQLTQQIEASKAQAQVVKEKAQRDADLAVKFAELNKNTALERENQKFEGLKLWHESEEKDRDRRLAIILKQMDINSHEDIALHQTQHASEIQKNDHSFKEKAGNADRRLRRDGEMIKAGHVPQPDGVPIEHVMSLFDRIDGSIKALAAPRRIDAIRDPQTNRIASFVQGPAEMPQEPAE